MHVRLLQVLVSYEIIEPIVGCCKCDDLTTGTRAFLGQSRPCMGPTNPASWERDAGKLHEEGPLLVVSNYRALAG